MRQHRGQWNTHPKYQLLPAWFALVEKPQVAQSRMDAPPRSGIRRQSRQGATLNKLAIRVGRHHARTCAFACSFFVSTNISTVISTCYLENCTAAFGSLHRSDAFNFIRNHITRCYNCYFYYCLYGFILSQCHLTLLWHKIEITSQTYKVSRWNINIRYRKPVSRRNVFVLGWS